MSMPVVPRARAGRCPMVTCSLRVSGRLPGGRILSGTHHCRRGTPAHPVLSATWVRQNQAHALDRSTSSRCTFLGRRYRRGMRNCVEIVRFVAADGDRPLVGVSDGSTVTELGETLGELLRLPLAELRDRCRPAGGPRHEAAGVRTLPPVDGRMEVWAAGVTYRRSREARITESERSADVYEQVYDADRPELFFKSTAWRVTGDGETVAIRSDSAVDVPEPELGLVLNRHAEIVGYTVVNDMSSRTIEGENPLYLPQA